MCPGTLALIAVGAQAAGGLLKGVSSAESASYQAQVARNNSTIERQNAAYSAGAASADTERAGLEARAKLASTRGALAANNMDVNSGSAATVQSSQRILGGLDTATVASRGAQKVYGYQSEATGYQAQANLDQSQVIPDLLGGVLSAGGSIAGGMADMPSGPSAANPGALSSPSLIEASPSVGVDYSWMQIGSGGLSNSMPDNEFG